MSRQLNDCGCGSFVVDGPDRGTDASVCRECDEPICEKCAGIFEVDGDCDEGVWVAHVYAYCKACYQGTMKHVCVTCKEVVYTTSCPTSEDGKVSSSVCAKEACRAAWRSLPAKKEATC